MKATLRYHHEVEYLVSSAVSMMQIGRRKELLKPTSRLLAFHRSLLKCPPPMQQHSFFRNLPPYFMK